MNGVRPAYIEDAPILQHERLTGDVHRMTVRAPGGGLPGQFYLVRARGQQEPLLARPISIHDTSGDIVRFLYQVRGRGTDVLSKLKVRDSVTLTGPLGKGFQTAQLHGNVAVVTGGIGIAPVLYLVRLLTHCRVTVIAGFRGYPYAVTDLMDVGVKVRIATEDGSAGTRGLCTDLLDPKAWDTVLTCGPMPMMSRVASLCAQDGVPCQASLEAHMACGVGACLVCTCATVIGNRRVCSDGPVFDAAEVVWNA
jgi:dihydroorotate dehydrogenase electron transfer subunit